MPNGKRLSSEKARTGRRCNTNFGPGLRATGVSPARFRPPGRTERADLLRKAFGSGECCWDLPHVQLVFSCTCAGEKRDRFLNLTMWGDAQLLGTRRTITGPDGNPSRCLIRMPGMRGSTPSRAMLRSSLLRVRIDSGQTVSDLGDASGLPFVVSFVPNPVDQVTPAGVC